MTSRARTHGVKTQKHSYVAGDLVEARREDQVHIPVAVQNNTPAPVWWQVAAKLQIQEQRKVMKTPLLEISTILSFEKVAVDGRRT